MVAVTLMGAPVVSYAATPSTSSVSSFQQQIAAMQAQLAALLGQTQSSGVSATFDGVDNSKVSVLYKNLPAKSYITLLWQDGEGQWSEVGQSKVFRKGGSGSVKIKITGIDPDTDGTPTGLFKLRVVRTADITNYTDSAVFSLDEEELAPTCTLTASDYNPDDAETRVKLKWTSENADYASAKMVYVSNNETVSAGTRLKPNGRKTVQPGISVKYIYTFYGNGGSTKCEVALGYKG